MGRPAILDDVKIAAKLAECRGNMTACAEHFKVSRAAIQKRVAASESLQSILYDARESMIDHAEGRLQEAIADREAWAVCFFLKTQAKHRGYVERQEVDASIDARGRLEIVEEIVVRHEGHSEDSPAPPDATGLLPLTGPV